MPIETPGVPCDPPWPMCTVVQGPNEAVVVLPCTAEQRLMVILRVSDDPELMCPGEGPLVAETGDYSLVSLSRGRGSLSTLMESGGRGLSQEAGRTAVFRPLPVLADPGTLLEVVKVE